MNPEEGMNSHTEQGPSREKKEPVYISADSEVVSDKGCDEKGCYPVENRHIEYLRFTEGLDPGAGHLIG